MKPYISSLGGILIFCFCEIFQLKIERKTWKIFNTQNGIEDYIKTVDNFIFMYIF